MTILLERVLLDGEDLPLHGQLGRADEVDERFKDTHVVRLIEFPVPAETTLSNVIIPGGPVTTTAGGPHAVGVTLTGKGLATAPKRPNEAPGLPTCMRNWKPPPSR